MCFGDILVEQVDQRLARGRRLHRSLQDDLLGIQIFAVEVLVGIVVGTQGRAGPAKFRQKVRDCATTTESPRS